MQQWDVGLPQGPMTPGFGCETFAFGDQKPPPRRIKEWSPIDRMLAEKGSKRRSKTELPPLSPPPLLRMTSSEVQVQTQSWEVILKEAIAAAVAPEHQKYKALQAEMQEMQQQLKEKDEELESCRRSFAQAQESHAAELAQYLEGKKSLDDFKKSVERQMAQILSLQQQLKEKDKEIESCKRSAAREIESCKQSAAEVQLTAQQEAQQAQESHAAELAQYLEGKKSLDDFKKSVERQRAEMLAMQQQLKEKDEEIESCKRSAADEIESFKLRAAEVQLTAQQEAQQAQESHAAELAQYLEGKKSLDDFKKSVERQRLDWTQERDTLEASQNLLRAELQSARTEASEERWHKEEMEKDLTSQLAAARKARADCREEMDSLQDQLRRSQDDMKSLQKQMAALKEEHAAVAKERDDLLQRLEDEQAEMIARVAAMEEQLSKRGR